MILRIIAAILGAFAVVTLTTAAATGQQQEVQKERSLVERHDKTVLLKRYDNAVKFIKRVDKKVNPCKGTKSYIVSKRLATWDWQEKLLVPKTETSYAEKRTNGCGYLKWMGKLWATRAHEHFKKYVTMQSPEAAICHVFGSYCSQALVVARCESGHSYSVRASNGQYQGMFQMGSSERARYGHGYTPLEQARAAYAYFVASGKDWSPWSCKPW